jgi:hypothetical protein
MVREKIRVFVITGTMAVETASGSNFKCQIPIFK